MDVLRCQHRKKYCFKNDDVTIGNILVNSGVEFHNIIKGKIIYFHECKSSRLSQKIFIKCLEIYILYSFTAYILLGDSKKAKRNNEINGR